ncbi:potassium-transporting ATPase subunit KdpB [Listeria booriae]|uniref:Potassium-transporting ATPase ATP-binding subunit n=1 Tax=Listeria booriae TaxID=1552123 RepID=A0A7X0XGS5_9LIST|nr:potassium-transporting ATPase subunit KdpB [Listeria booriae]MBC1560746.1 potassium-transporting ATPase subunit KdpB [Listeria booriae]
MEKKMALFNRDMMFTAIKNSFIKLNPADMIKNPVMFVVEVGTFVVLLLMLFPSFFGVTGSFGYELAIFIILFVTILFANFAESLAEGRGKAQADSLKKTKSDTTAKLLQKDGSVKQVAASTLHKGDVVLVEVGDLIPSDGEIIEGLASIDESAITGESAPVIKESGGDFASVTGGTMVLSDAIKVRIESNPGESFLDKMISMVEGAKRQKTPNEIALTILLITLTIIFLIVVITLYPIARFNGVMLSMTTLVALLVCLIPTTIGALLSAIGIAGMDRVTRFNVLAMSGKAVEAAGDINTIILDKTGTITFGNRMASEFLPVGEHSVAEVAEIAAISSLKDDTPEGKSVLILAKQMEITFLDDTSQIAEEIEFQANTRMSGITLQDGRKIRKGAADSISRWVQDLGGELPANMQEVGDSIARLGGTPLAVSVDDEVYGFIYLKDTVKPGMQERFAELRKMGIKTIMCTGDNPLTAKTIAAEAGVDDYIAESKPEDKIQVIKDEQALGKLVAMTGDGTNDAPALAQADVGLAMNSGTIAAKEAANMVDLDSDPTKIIEVVSIGKQLLMTRGALTTFSIANDIAKYFAIIPAMFAIAIPAMNQLNIMQLASPTSAIISALIFNAIIIPILIPLAMKGVKYVPMKASKLLQKNLFIYGLGGVIAPFFGIKIIDLAVSVFI